MKKINNVFKTILVTALCLMTLVTFMPAGTLGDVFAADSAAEQQQSTVDTGHYGTVTSTKTTFDNPTATSLGSVASYGVFAETYTQTGDQEAMVAVKTLDANANIGRTGSVVSFNSAESYNYVESFKWPFRTHNYGSQDWIFGDQVEKDHNYNNGLHIRDTATKVENSWNGMNEFGGSIRNISETSYQINFNDAFDGLRSYAKKMYSGTTNTVPVEKSGDNRTISCPDGFHVINMSVQELNEDNGHLIIKQAEDGTGAYSLIINVTGLNNQTSIDMKNDVSVDGQKNGYAFAIGKVMFNFGEYGGTVNYNGNNEAGVILAPNATLKFSSGHHAGSVYAKNVESSVEIHQIMFQPTPTPSNETGSLKIVKTTNGAEDREDDKWRNNAGRYRVQHHGTGRIPSYGEIFRVQRRCIRAEQPSGRRVYRNGNCGFGEGGRLYAGCERKW
nr:collagen-binding domain-containing protein [Eubacterium pyruvativorans]